MKTGIGNSGRERECLSVPFALGEGQNGRGEREGHKKSGSEHKGNPRVRVGERVVSEHFESCWLSETGEVWSRNEKKAGNVILCDPS